MLVDHPATVQVREPQTQRGDGQLHVGGVPGHGDPVPQHPRDPRPLAPPPAAPRPGAGLAHAVNALLGYGRPGTRGLLVALHHF